MEMQFLVARFKLLDQLVWVKLVRILWESLSFEPIEKKRNKKKKIIRKNG